MNPQAAPPIRSDWPFDIRRVPFYYGWLIWVFSTLGIIIIGTVGSSLFLTRAGRWYDRLGGRVTVTAASAALAVMILFISASDSLAIHFGGGVVVAQDTPGDTAQAAF